MAAGIVDLEALESVERARINRGDVFGPAVLPLDLSIATGDLAAPSGGSPVWLEGMSAGELNRRAVLATLLLLAGELRQAEEWILPALGAAEISELRHSDDFIFHGAPAMLFALQGDIERSEYHFRQIWRRREDVLPMYASAGVGFDIDFLILPYRTDSLDDRYRLAKVVDEIATSGVDMLGPGWSPRHQLCFLFHEDGNWSGVIQEAVSSDLRRGRAFFAQKIRGTDAAVALRQGRVGHFRTQLRHVFPNGPKTRLGDAHILPALLLQRDAATLAISDGDMQSAFDWLTMHDSWIQRSGIVPGRAEGQLGWARYRRATGDLHESREHAERAHKLASNPRQPLALIAADRFLGQLDVDQGKYDEAKRRLDASLELAERCEAPFEQALTLVVMAERAAKLGDAEESREFINRVREICEPLGAKPTLERVGEIEAMLPGARRSSEDHPFGLTGREVEVLRLVARGRTDAEAAEELFISPRTVSQHLRNAYNKIGVNNRAEATRVAVEQGIV
ncbi:MAG: LuxR C-terminal-related transcriptional regulator [Thermomicrobiales bacterium]